jgi:hypothetical protein
MVNTQLVESLVQVIHALSSEERFLLEEKLFFEMSEVSTKEIMNLAMVDGSFDFLNDESDIYSLEDGEPV